MTPREFRQEKELEFDHFTELTSTGIKPNYVNIELFAHEYHKRKLKLLGIANVGWQSEQLPEFDVQEINEIVKDCKEKQEDFTTLICKVWNKAYMTAVNDEREV